MPVTYVSGDPLLTQAQLLAFGCNARGRAEVDALQTLLLNRHPAAFATFHKQCRSERIKAGSLWIWRQSRPMLGFMVVRDAPMGATRLRYVETIVLTLARDFRLDGVTSLAIAPLGDPGEWPILQPVIQHWLGPSSLPCVIYERYIPGLAAEV